MKLEVGMYVRTKNGYIRKIDRIWNDTDFNVDKIYYNDNIYEDTLGCVLNEDIKGKPTFNVIDLIEEGDYVNGYAVYEILEYEDNTRAIVVGDDNKSIIWEESSQYIKSIVTKEQFESMSYKIN